MANHLKFNKIIRKLDRRQLFCKAFYDNYMNQIKIEKGNNEVYFKKEVDNSIEQLKELYDEQQDEIVRQKKKADDLSLENYQLKKEFKRKMELKQKL